MRGIYLRNQNLREVYMSRYSIFMPRHIINRTLLALQLWILSTSLFVKNVKLFISSCSTNYNLQSIKVYLSYIVSHAVGVVSREMCK